MGEQPREHLGESQKSSAGVRSLQLKGPWRGTEKTDMPTRREPWGGQSAIERALRSYQCEPKQPRLPTEWTSTAAGSMSSGVLVLLPATPKHRRGPVTSARGWRDCPQRWEGGKNKEQARSLLLTCPKSQAPIALEGEEEMRLVFNAGKTCYNQRE